MKGLSSFGKERVEEAVGTLFDKLIYRLLGYNPNNKRIEFFVKRPDETLLDLYIKNLGGKPNEVELDVAKKVIKSSYGYLSALREKTKTSVSDKIEAHLNEAHLNGTVLSPKDIEKTIEDEMAKAKTHFGTIAVTETTRAKNIGNTMRITRMAAAEGEEDPNVYFVVKRDSHTCKFCINNHLLPDGTPKVFKLSQIKQGYLSYEDRKSGECSVHGQHPNCRCALAYIGKHFGFKDGKLTFIGFGHDEHSFQNSKKD